MDTVIKPATILLSYFKPSGKWYTDVEHTAEYLHIHPPTYDLVYTYDVVEDLRKRWRIGQLPGLTNGGWEGYILIGGEKVLPHLLTGPR